MDHTPPDDAIALRAVLRDFCEKHVKPNAREWDRSEHFPAEVVGELGRLRSSECESIPSTAEREWAASPWRPR